MDVACWADPGTGVSERLLYIYNLYLGLKSTRLRDIKVVVHLCEMLKKSLEKS
jgi:hypothetical protein